MHGAFDVDAYAYNKPVGKLLGQQQTAPAMPMGKLLEQLSQSSRSELAVAKLRAQYRNLDDELAEAEDEDDAGEGTSASGTIINKRLAELARDNLYSHEFLVQTKGKKKFVQLNTLSRPGPGEAHKPETPEVMAETQTQPLNVKLALPELQEELEDEEQEEKNDPVKHKDEQVELLTEQLKVNQNASTSEPKYTEAISTMQQMEAKLTSEAIGKQQKQQQDANADSRPGGGVKDAQNMATIEAPNAANAAGKPKGQQEVQEKEKPKEQAEQEQKASHQISSAAIAAASSPAAAAAAATDDDDDDAKQSDSRPDNDGQVNGMNVAPTAAAESVGEAVGTPVGPAVGATSDKPLSLSLSSAKSKRKQIQRQTQTQTKQKTKTKTKTANEIDTKPTSASNVGQRVQGMSVASHAASVTNVKAPAKESPEISQQDIRRPVQKVKGNGMDMMGKMAKGKGKGKRQGQGQSKRKGAQRRPSEEQEIETTTNWWHILPYAEIRKFLNTIYDSITDEDDDERAQRI